VNWQSAPTKNQHTLSWFPSSSLGIQTWKLQPPVSRSWSLGTRRTLTVFAFLRALRVFVVNSFLIPKLELGNQGKNLFKLLIIQRQFFYFVFTQLLCNQAHTAVNIIVPLAVFIFQQGSGEIVGLLACQCGNILFFALPF